MKKYKWIIILLNLIIVLVVFNNSVVKKETLLTDGTLILLELTPVDPRSLMQGDYMDLRYAISDNLNDNYDNEDSSKRGFCVVTLDDNKVAKRVRLQNHKTPLNRKEFLIEYNARQWNGITIGAESFFFQEGTAEKYENAKYGGLKIDSEGNSLLVGLYDENRNKIE
ncbi:GDYXXLXY domain-containing protein [Bizionia saleffrena]|uniref:GDYXXLXY domain-containing protein n=1 Tax=Bizionia saleffrena TaxID=291189 RepID=A0A8H2LCB1_9FLAO|nr:GDYXXLXY domain-containing protein [Bizionia saleffrena]TYB72659.1 GDYXXLXY domain-containing protein [Bizionia saleffrena]